jgi:hypothetical protein
MDEFRFADLGRVHWPATAKVGLARGFASGIMWMLLNLIMQPPSAGSIGSLLVLPFGMAVLAIPLGLFFQLAGRVAGAIIPLMGAFFNLVGSLMVCLGDPLVFFFNRRFPHILDVADFGFFNLTPLLFITHPE